MQVTQLSWVKLACKYSRLSSLLVTTGDSQERRVRLNDKKSIVMTLNLFGIWWGARIG